MNAAQIREDVIERLEGAKKHVMDAVLFIDELEGNGHAMCAVKEIGYALDTLQGYLARLEKWERAADDEPSAVDVREAEGIRALAGALQTKARP